jgi:hypothetical protein
MKKSESLKFMMCAVRSFENIDEDNVEEWLQSGVCELGFQTLSVLLQNKQEKRRVGRMKEEVVSTSVKAWHYNVLTLY